MDICVYITKEMCKEKLHFVRCHYDPLYFNEISQSVKRDEH